MTYLDELQQETEAVLAASYRKQIEDNAKWQHALTPLEDRLARVLADIPEEVKRQGLSLPNIQKMLKGRWRGNCHPGELGACLRRSGWIRRRSWRGDEAGFFTLWRKP